MDVVTGNNSHCFINCCSEASNAPSWTLPSWFLFATRSKTRGWSLCCAPDNSELENVQNYNGTLVKVVFLHVNSIQLHAEAWLQVVQQSSTTKTLNTAFLGDQKDCDYRPQTVKELHFENSHGATDQSQGCHVLQHTLLHDLFDWMGPYFTKSSCC